MRQTLIGAALAAALQVPLGASAGDTSDMADIKRMIEGMKADYERRIESLEQRLEKAEAAAAKADDRAREAARADADATAKSAKGFGAMTSGTAFNPQISVILDGNYYHDDADGEGTELLGSVDGINHAHGGGHEHGGGHGHGGADQGFNFRSAELAFSASVDPYFDARAQLAIDSDGEVDLEEAWFQTRSLPYGFKIKGGKFLSDIGYINNQHPHQWDFTDQNLAYLNLLGDHGLQETGIQATWLPDWGHYTLFGVEVLQGDQERLGALVDDEALHEAAEEAGVEEDDLGLDAANDGPRLYTAFLKYAPDLGYDHALQLGTWGAWADQHQEIHEEPVIHALDGDAWMWGLDAVYKYSAGRGHGAGDIKLQGEYLWQRKDLNLAFHEANPGLVGAERKFTQDGFYLQGLYGIAPRWQLGLRYDKVGLTSELESAGQVLREWDDSDRWTAALTWTPTEFSRLRLQYAMADLSVEGERRDVDYIYLQFLMSLGSHGAHKF